MFCDLIGPIKTKINNELTKCNVLSINICKFIIVFINLLILINVFIYIMYIYFKHLKKCLKGWQGVALALTLFIPLINHNIIKLSLIILTKVITFL